MLEAFLTGGLARVIWGEVSAYVTKKQDHKYEIERIEKNEEVAQKQFERNLQLVKVQADLETKKIVLVSDAALESQAAATFDKGVEIAGKTTGFAWIDQWNAAIRAAIATEMMIVLALHYYHSNFVMDDRLWELAGAALGIFIADRTLFRRGK